jgi:hypothetical protein
MVHETTGADVKTRSPQLLSLNEDEFLELVIRAWGDFI